MLTQKLRRAYNSLRHSIGRTYKGIIIIGPSGAGKDTQANLLIPYGYFPFSSGEELRLSEEGTELRAKIDEGNLAPDDRIAEILEERLKVYIQNGQFDPDLDTLVLNGVPRTLAQVRMLEKFVYVTKVIYLQAKPEECKRRLVHRFETEGRADDSTIDAINTRVDGFMGEPYDCINGYKGLVRVINGNYSIEEVHEQIKEALNIH